MRINLSILVFPFVPPNEPAVLDLERARFPGLSHQGNHPVPRLYLLELLLFLGRHMVHPSVR